MSNAGRRAAAPVELQPVHRMAFLQALMAAGYLTEAACKAKLYQITGAQSDDLYAKVISESNASLEFANFRVRNIVNPVDSVRYVGFTNTVADDLSKVASKYSIPQREFYKQVIEAIASSTEHSAPGAPHLPETTLLNMNLAAGRDQVGPSTQASQPANQDVSAAVAAALKKMTKQERSRTLKQLVDDGWLAFSQAEEGYYCLGPRTFLELSDYLLSLQDLPDNTKDAWRQVL